MIKELVATLLLSGSIGVKTQTIQPRRVITDNYTIYGCYNFRDSWDGLLSITENDYSTSIVFESPGDGSNTPLWSMRTPLVTGDNSHQQLYLKSIGLVFSSADYSLDITFYCYDLWTNDFEPSFTIERGDDLTDFGYGGLFFYCHDSIILHGLQAQFFTALFTTDDNYYNVSYTGYYSFTSNLTTIPNYIAGLGSMLFNNSLTYGFTNYGYSEHSLGFYSYDVVDRVYYINVYSLPFDTKVVNSSNILMTNVKMSKTTKQFLENVGIFAYVRDSSYDNTTFQDLFFSVMDSPIYMLSRLLSLEIFGINLYIALTGLLTICVILVLIKKFF